MTIKPTIFGRLRARPKGRELRDQPQPPQQITGTLDLSKLESIRLVVSNAPEHEERIESVARSLQTLSLIRRGGNEITQLEQILTIERVPPKDDEEKRTFFDVRLSAKADSTSGDCLAAAGAFLTLLNDEPKVTITLKDGPHLRGLTLGRHSDPNAEVWGFYATNFVPPSEYPLRRGVYVITSGLASLNS